MNFNQSCIFSFYFLSPSTFIFLLSSIGWGKNLLHLVLLLLFQHRVPLRVQTKGAGCSNVFWKNNVVVVCARVFEGGVCRISFTGTGHNTDRARRLTRGLPLPALPSSSGGEETKLKKKKSWCSCNHGCKRKKKFSKNTSRVTSLFDNPLISAEGAAGERTFWPKHGRHRNIGRLTCFFSCSSDFPNFPPKKSII